MSGSTVREVPEETSGGRDERKERAETREKETRAGDGSSNQCREMEHERNGKGT